MGISNNENWHVEFNRSAMREIYPSRELNENALGAEFNDVNGLGAGGTAPWPGEYSDSLKEVRNLGRIKEGFGFKFFSGATLVGGAAIAISVTAIMAQINKYKPKVNHEDVKISTVVRGEEKINQLSFMLNLTYNDKNTATLTVKGGDKVVFSNKYTLPPLEEGETKHTYAFKETIDLKDIESRSYTVDFKCSNSFGSFSVYSKVFDNPLKHDKKEHEEDEIINNIDESVEKELESQM